MTQFAIVIMAAGKGTRLKSRRPRYCTRLAGKPSYGMWWTRQGRLYRRRMSTSWWGMRRGW